MPTVRTPDSITFYPIEGETTGSLKPNHITYDCGVCGKSTNGRVLCVGTRGGDSVSTMRVCLCSCGQREPSILIEKDKVMISQLPAACEFHPSDKWPPDLAKLYDEAAKSYAAGAFTASSMVCRKLLMSCACHEKADDGRAFASYVDYITNTVLTFPRAKDAIDAIRSIGNDANHDVAFVSADDAKRAMKIMSYMLNTIYSLPTA
jgi:hypothetical protein